jgi:hypothetical protein
MAFNVSRDQIVGLAAMLGVDPAAVAAVVATESSGSGFLPAPSRSPGGLDVSGWILIRFEAHVFYGELQKRKIDPNKVEAPRPDIIRRVRDDSLVKGAAREWDRLDAARTVHAEAADCSASWGAFQIMGFNWRQAGAASVSDFVERMGGADGQAALFAGLVRSSASLLKALRDHDWLAFALLYNGRGQKGYDVKMARNYRRALKTYAC